MLELLSDEASRATGVRPLVAMERRASDIGRCFERFDAQRVLHKALEHRGSLPLLDRYRVLRAYCDEACTDLLCPHASCGLLSRFNGGLVVLHCQLEELRRAGRAAPGCSRRCPHYPGRAGRQAPPHTSWSDTGAVSRVAASSGRAVGHYCMTCPRCNNNNSRACAQGCRRVAHVAPNSINTGPAQPVHSAGRVFENRFAPPGYDPRPGPPQESQQQINNICCWVPDSLLQYFASY